MRIVLIDLNGPFGPLRSYVELVPALIERGIEIDFIVPSRSLPLLDELAPQCSTLVVDRPHSLTRDWEVGRAVRRRLGEGGNIVHANSTSAVRGASVGVLGTRAPMVVHLRNSRLSRLEVVMLRSLACTPNPVRYIAVSGGAACTIEGLPKDAVTVLGDAVSAPRARGTRGLNDPARVGLVLNQQPTKGLDIFVEAVAKLASSNIQWEVFGSAGIVPPPAGYVAESMSRLSQMGVADKVHFRGIVPSMTAEFQKLDAFLITSRRESFSRVAAEALMSGLPLVAPVIPGLIETVDGGRLAHMYPLADASAAASAVQVVLSDYHSALSMAQIGMRWGESRFSADAVAGEMRKLYTELLVRPTSARSRS